MLKLKKQSRTTESRAKPLFLTAGEKMIPGGAVIAPLISCSASGKALVESLRRWWQGFCLPPIVSIVYIIYHLTNSINLRRTIQTIERRIIDLRYAIDSRIYYRLTCYYISCQNVLGWLKIHSIGRGCNLGSFIDLEGFIKYFLIGA